MKITGQIIKSILIITILTILTQIGGLIYLIYKPIGIQVKKRIENKIKSWIIRLSIFGGLMIISSTIIIPPIAKQYGRVNLPIRSNNQVPIEPVNLLMIIANRHYVKSELKNSIIEIAKTFNKKYPGTEIIYLDANFPFIDNFPLLPHRSHDDGEKLDIGFIYKDSKTGDRINKSPTIFGYGFSEKPKNGEFDQPGDCEKKGYWQYNFINKLTFEKKRYQFDHQANKELIQILTKDSRIGKIFIEPHLKTRLGFDNYIKIRFHGCKAVRHDDHIHLQL